MSDDIVKENPKSKEETKNSDIDKNKLPQKKRKKKKNQMIKILLMKYKK